MSIDAGDFYTWLIDFRLALQTRGAMDVACGDCIGCCTSSQFIGIDPGDDAAIVEIDRQYLFPAPGRSTGHFVLGFDENGKCPMLKSSLCRIYSQRPRTCRQYDCRVFAAASIPAGGADKAAINERVNRWRFSYASELDSVRHLAVKSAASYIRDNAIQFPGNRVPTQPSELAIMAVKVYEVFFDEDRGEILET